MNLRTSDFLMTRFAQAAPGVLKMLAEVESDALRGRIGSDTIDRPVFIAGLARSGTTILLNVFSGLPNVGTHQYRDFPFLFVPCWWNQFQDHLAQAEAPVERPHKDRIYITKDSPEAFEEPIWMHFFPFVHRPDAQHLLTGADSNPKFDEFYIEHLRKILFVRGASRYVSKGNYNLARIRYLARLLPDARFVIPVRHPLQHVHSLVRQHGLFERYSRDDPRIGRYMRAAGHFEFGPQRVPINVDFHSPPRILDAWARGDDYGGYAILWRSVYEHVLAISETGPLSDRIRIVRYEDFCSDPATVLRNVFEFCGLEEGIEQRLRSLPPISPPTRVPDVPTQVSEAVWQQTCKLAGRFGYEQ